MEFHEKLQALRKSKQMTQEELAKALYVSRTAISKWESGRGYPSIDSLKEISRYFSVSIDDLLSAEKVISLAEKENKSNVRSLCGLFFGIMDLLSILLILLPLYPKPGDGVIYSVPLLSYTASAPLIRGVYWFLFLILTVLGAVRIAFVRLHIEKGCRLMTGCSLTLGTLAVLLPALTRLPYATVVAFLLLLLKIILILTSDSPGI